MKKAIIALTFGLLAMGANAQSVSITIVADDGGTTTTNVISVPAVRVQGLLTLWGENTTTRTNAGLAALTFGQFIVQEIRDRGTEYANKGAVKDMLSWGITNPPPRLVAAWPGLTADQKATAANYHNQIGN